MRRPLPAWWWFWAAGQALFWVGGAARLRRWHHASLTGATRDGAPRSEGTAQTVLTFLRPLKTRGAPPASDLVAFIARLGSKDEAIFGVDTGPAGDALAAAVENLVGGDSRVRVVRCGDAGFANRKIDKLAQMTRHARGDRWILLDSEALPSATFLQEVRRTLSPATAVTAAYAFVGTAGLAGSADVISTSGFLFSGYAWARQAGARPTAFGACLGLTREMWERVGGWERFGNRLADDYELGRALHEAGYEIRACREVLPLRVDPVGWREFWEHQRRVALTYRVSQPAGFGAAGAVLTLPLVVVAFRRGARAGACALVVGWGIRVVAQTLTQRTLGTEVGPMRLLILTPVTVVTEAAAWAASWASDRLRWGDRAFRVGGDGTLRTEPSER